MRLHRFFVSEEIPEGQRIVIRDEKLINQWRNVFRYTTGSRVILFDGTGAEYLALIGSITPNKAELQILDKEVKESKKAIKDKEICLFLSIIKNNNFDLVLQKAAELGVDRVVPVIADRTVKKNVNLERSNRILVEASEQSGRTDLVSLDLPLDLKKALETFDGKVIICQSGGAQWSKKLLSGDKNVAFLIGPEGGWSPAELSYFEQKKYARLSLGEHTLRAETAAIAVLSLALLQ